MDIRFELKTAADKHLNFASPENERPSESGIPHGFCSFSGTPGRKDKPRTFTIASYSNPSPVNAGANPMLAYDKQHLHANPRASPGDPVYSLPYDPAYRPEAQDGSLASAQHMTDDEIWQEYRKESARLKIHHRITMA